ncbi:MAG TPA: succinyldiaminopimelate transaminase [Burkholderiaceae bacterium]|nr:succinyldiaminopimelate transaminase [Burkholderiaceae bacterium]
MNRYIDSLQPYPFERLRALLAGTTPSAAHPPISMSIGEPKHPAPRCVRDALVAGLDGLSVYPPTLGGAALREAIAAWLVRRHGLPSIDPATQVLPVNGSKEALFSIAQLVVDPTAGGARPAVLMPNPCYQVYEGAALLAGAEPVYVGQHEADGFASDWDAVPADVWPRVRLVYVCSPGNPAGTVVRRDEWRRLFELSARHGFVIAADECYSEIYPDDDAPPESALAAAHALGLAGFERLLVFSSLSKRSSVPGLRSGFVAGDARLLERYLLLRSYNGSAMSLAVQAASTAAWTDEAHVVENRRLYRAKFDAVLPLLDGALRVRAPEGGFFLWAGVPGGDDAAFARDLYAQYNVTTLPGGFLARSVDGRDPGAGFVRLALVDGLDACVEAARRIREFTARSASTEAPSR